MLPLADFASSIKTTLSDEEILIIPQIMEAGSEKTHPHLFYIEHPVSSGFHYQISTKKLLAIIGDGATSRAFTANILSRLLPKVATRIQAAKLLKAISLN